jgi:hypothetical protein
MSVRLSWVYRLGIQLIDSIYDFLMGVIKAENIN